MFICRQKINFIPYAFMKILKRYANLFWVLWACLVVLTNFRVLQVIEKSLNLIGQEHFGPYLRNQNFFKYEICSTYSNYNNANFHYRPNREKIKELRKKLNFPIHSNNPRLGLFSPFLGKNIIFKKSGSVMHNTKWPPNSRKNLRANSKKTSKQQDWQTLFIWPFWPWPGTL